MVHLFGDALNTQNDRSDPGSLNLAVSKYVLDNKGDIGGAEKLVVFSAF